MFFIVRTENQPRTGTRREEHRAQVLGQQAPEGTRQAYLRVDGQGSFVVVEAQDEAWVWQHTRELAPYAKVVEVVPVVPRDVFLAHLPSKPEGQPMREFLKDLARKLG